MARVKALNNFGSEERYEMRPDINNEEKIGRT
jgi:hypothetical protein